MLEITIKPISTLIDVKLMYDIDKLIKFEMFKHIY